jgi:hypothetical protein
MIYLPQVAWSVAATVPRLRMMSHQWDTAAEHCRTSVPAASSRRTVSAVRHHRSAGRPLGRTEGPRKAMSARGSGVRTPRGPRRHAFCCCVESDTCSLAPWKAVLACAGALCQDSRLSSHGGCAHRRLRRGRAGGVPNLCRPNMATTDAVGFSQKRVETRAYRRGLQTRWAESIPWGQLTPMALEIDRHH